MAALGPLVIALQADFGIVPLQLEVLSDYLAAPTPRERRIELNAMRALCEIERMGRAARADLGLETGAGAIAVRLEVSEAAASPEAPAEAGLIEAADQVAEALENISDFWAYGMAKAEGAKPTPEDDAAVHAIAALARNALVSYRRRRGTGARAWKGRR